MAEHQERDWKDGALRMRVGDLRGEHVPVKYAVDIPFRFDIDRQVTLPACGTGEAHAILTDSDGNMVCEILLGQIAHGQIASFPAGNFLRISTWPN